MAIFKCKMCGGTIEFEPGSTVGICDSCGTKQTLPHLDDDRRANLYDRANHFRRNNEFDKAAGIYEQILNEDTADAEAYWSLVLCRYGIEYVEDPKTRRRVPTVNRAQFTSFFDDDNYKSALQYADGYQRELYENEAKEINDIQKGILAISQKEEPFDVFICYKETDTNGRRTQDSVLANDLYHQLTQEGFKVFFSRITLEDKLGTAYEPYIFAALNSAKVMVVLGTKPEYFNAVWVKNEWSRYLALVKQSAGKKVLIPAYRDMDPYDLPEEFSHLQAQDMSKLGFMQDLIRGIKKIANTTNGATVVVKETVTSSGNVNTKPLLTRAFMFLEDGNWEEADAYCERVLDQDPQNAQAYLGKLLAEMHVAKQEDLQYSDQTFENSSNYQKAMRFDKDNLGTKLIELRKLRIYNSAVKTMNTAGTEAGFKNAAETFKTISGFKDVDELADQCLLKAEECRKNAIYDEAQRYMEDGRKNTSADREQAMRSYQIAINTFSEILGWKDAEYQNQECRNCIEIIKTQIETARLENERQQELRRIANKKAARKRKRTITIVTPIVVACISFIIVLTTVIIPNRKYKAAVELYNAGRYEDAIAAFTALAGYKDSAMQIEKCETAIKDEKYVAAVELYNAGKNEDAIAVFTDLDGYKDSVSQIKKCETAINDAKYNAAVALIEEGDIINAYENLIALNGYKESKLKAKEIYVQYEIAKLKAAKVGEIVCFGSYEQDNNTVNGKEDIEWLVLEKKEDRVLAISKYALDSQPFNTSDTKVTWETCSLRRWLNSTFKNAAFNSAEQSSIISATVTTDKNPDWTSSPGNNTTDKVFLLSITEVKKYFFYETRKCQPTKYAIEQGTIRNKKNPDEADWWLRTPGYSEGNSNNFTYIDSDGSIKTFGMDANIQSWTVRPAMWIKIEQ